MWKNQKVYCSSLRVSHRREWSRSGEREMVSGSIPGMKSGIWQNVAELTAWREKKKFSFHLARSSRRLNRSPAPCGYYTTPARDPIKNLIKINVVLCLLPFHLRMTLENTPPRDRFDRKIALPIKRFRAFFWCFFFNFYFTSRGAGNRWRKAPNNSKSQHVHSTNPWEIPPLHLDRQHIEHHSIFSYTQNMLQVN